MSALILYREARQVSVGEIIDSGEPRCTVEADAVMSCAMLSTMSARDTMVEAEGLSNLPPHVPVAADRCWRGGNEPLWLLFHASHVSHACAA